MARFNRYTIVCETMYGYIIYEIVARTPKIAMQTVCHNANYLSDKIMQFSILINPTPAQRGPGGHINPDSLTRWETYHYGI